MGRVTEGCSPWGGGGSSVLAAAILVLVSVVCIVLGDSQCSAEI